jgi:putative phage-type endonuclease
MITKIKTNSHDEWLALRKKYIGGSDAATIVGLNPFASKYSLWAEKTGKVPSFEGNLATEVGTYLEDFVAKLFEKETGKKVRREKASILNDLYPHAIANVDRMVVGEDAGLEIKTTNSLALSKFKHGEFPSRYYAQCVHYLALTQKSKWYLAILIGNNEFKWFEINRDEAEIDALMDAELDFYRDHILLDVPPPLDGSEQTTKAVSTIYDEEEDSECDISDIDDIIQDYFDLKEQAKMIDKLAEAKANEIKQHLGSSTYGTSSLACVTWKSQERSTFDRKAFERTFPHIDLSKYYKTSNSRVLRVKKIGE